MSYSLGDKEKPILETFRIKKKNFFRGAATPVKELASLGLLSVFLSQPIIYHNEIETNLNTYLILLVNNFVCLGLGSPQ